MKKTVFVGRVNDQEFDNVQDYNTCVQAMLDMGKDFQATSSTQVVEVPEDDCECTCSGKDECSKCNRTEKPLKPVTAMLPAYDNRNNGEYIDAFISAESDDAFNASMDDLDNKLNEVYDRVAESIPKNTPEQLAVYGGAVNEMMEILENDLAKTKKAQEPIVERINELEDELKNLYEASNKLDRAEDVISTYGEFYDAIQGLLIQNTADRTVGDEVTDEQVQETAQRLTAGFASLLREIFGK